MESNSVCNHASRVVLKLYRYMIIHFLSRRFHVFVVFILHNFSSLDSLGSLESLLAPSYPIFPGLPSLRFVPYVVDFTFRHLLCEELNARPTNRMLNTHWLRDARNCLLLLLVTSALSNLPSAETTKKCNTKSG